jgi:FdhD protein
MRAIRDAEVTRFETGSVGPAAEPRVLVAEEPLVIRVTGGPSFTIMRTPGNERELAAGFLLAEGLIRGVGDLASIDGLPDEENEIRVTLTRVPEGMESRTLAVVSACGLCGRPDPGALVDELDPVPAGPVVPLADLYAVPAKVREAQPLFAKTGGTHAAALVGTGGRLVAVFEDLGRHNAFDKAIGHALLTGLELPGHWAFLTGRVSLEMVVKAARAGLGLVAAVSAPTASAVDVARRLGITVCGFVRGREVTVYSHPERIGKEEI